VIALRRLPVLCAAVLATAALSDAADPKPAPPAADAKAPAAPSAAPAPAATPAKSPAPKAEDKPVTLPVFQVSGARLREIDLKIKKLEKQIEREKTALEKSALDDTLNNDKVSNAAALFGGKSTSQRESVAVVRIESMEKELQLLDTLRTPLTNADRDLIEKLIDDQRVYRRSLDEALR
jgi:pyruvate/2-oxoglutarate dehydrogenase complex dihydrolipoamide acyltransferase (E2) component